MEALKTNVDHYMKLKGIKRYSHLLVNIAHELGIKGQDAYVFAEREKSNFSKMLKGERPLKYDFIIPIPGSRKVERLKSNFEAGNVELSEEEIKVIDDKLNSMEFKVFGGH